MWTLLSSLVFAILVCQQFCGGITFTCVGVYSAMCPVARYVCWGHMMKLIFAFFFYKLVTTNSVFTAAANSSAATLVLIFAAIVGLVRRCFQIVMRIFRYISSAYVSSIFRVAGNSDFVWEKFIPSVYGRLISSSTHLSFSSKKELYRCLCESILIDNGRKIFKIEKLTRKITYVLSARDRSITWGDQRHYWSWSHRSDSKSTLKNFKLYYKDPTYNGQVRNHRKNPNRSFIAEHELRSLSDYESEEHMD
ncbi:hypothetical protein Bca4012_070091 [Brassica carinata]|uniref:Uncharacterized protein n=1 Tax=Brassica carinata TaxID=52824 RepID=A0A8X7QFG4_BRACI|nr:hypothetical protein Bca52824_062240 [Brassica carinata]